MEKISLNTNEAPDITLDIKGNLTVKGWPNTEVIASCSSKEDLKVEEVGDQIQIICHSDCTVKIPYGAILDNVIVSGNGSIKSVEGTINVEIVYGNLTLRSVGSSTIGVVHGNLVAKNISGELRLNAIKGNANVKDVQLITTPLHLQEGMPPSIWIHHQGTHIPLRQMAIYPATSHQMQARM